jgi:hypothetical protein
MGGTQFWTTGHGITGVSVGMERKSPANEGARSRSPVYPGNRLVLALVIALIAHLVVVLGAKPFRAGLLRVRVALGLALPAAQRPTQPRDDDWIRIEFDRSEASTRRVPPVGLPTVRAAAVAPPQPRGGVPRRAQKRSRRSRLVASLSRRPRGQVKSSVKAVEPPTRREGPRVEPPRWLHMRPRAKQVVAPNSTRPRRRLDLVYRPLPGELRVARVDKGRLRVAGSPKVAKEEMAKSPGRDHGTGRWRPIPQRLLVARARPSGGFHVDGRSRPVYAGVRLRRVGQGRWRYHGPKCTFNATIHPDGQVSFRDLPSISLGKVRGAPPMRIPGDSQARAFSGIVVGVSFTFDINDAVMRSIGQDPYSAEKRRFARLTRAWRLQLRARFQRRVRREALARFGIGSGLCRRYRGLNADGRRRTRRWLFARWDETREDARGKPLRAALMGAIRRCSIHYPVAELGRLNARRRGRSHGRGQGMVQFRP